MRARYGYDNVWSLFYVGKEAELLGCRDILYAEDGPPNVADFVIKNYDDIAKLEVPDDITAHPAWTETGKCLEDPAPTKSAPRHPICAYITASTTLPALLMGMEKWLELLTDRPGRPARRTAAQVLGLLPQGNRRLSCRRCQRADLFDAFRLDLLRRHEALPRLVPCPG